MRALVQRTSAASVVVDDETVGAIGQGLVVLVGVTHGDTEAQAIKLAQKLYKLRVFDDSEGKMNLSVVDVGGDVLVVSQFTLYGDARKGNRPSYVDAARPEQAEPLIELVVAELAALGADAGVTVSTGRFRTDMAVTLTNDGPVTLLIEV